MEWLFLLGVLVCAIIFPKFRKVLIALALLFGGLDRAYFLINQRIEESCVTGQNCSWRGGAFGSPTRFPVPNVSITTSKGVFGTVPPNTAASDFTLKLTLEDCI